MMRAKPTSEAADRCRSANQPAAETAAITTAASTISRARPIIVVNMPLPAAGGAQRLVNHTFQPSLNVYSGVLPGIIGDRTSRPHDVDLERGARRRRARGQDEPRAP